MVKGEIIGVYIPKELLDKLDEYAQSKLLTRGRAIVSILAEYFNLGGGNEGDAGQSD